MTLDLRSPNRSLTVSKHLSCTNHWKVYRWVLPSNCGLLFTSYQSLDRFTKYSETTSWQALARCCRLIYKGLAALFTCKCEHSSILPLGSISELTTYSCIASLWFYYKRKSLQMQYHFTKYCDNYVILRSSFSANSNCNFCYALNILQACTFVFMFCHHIFLMKAFKNWRILHN